VYLLPESVDPARDGVKHPDAIVDGSVVEFKTITGKVRQIEEHFKESRKKANIVFFKIDSPLSKEAVIKKLEGVILQKGYHGGQVIAYFSETAQLYYWDIDDLR
jgi:methionine salvage enolase-phosphatase E1